MKPELIVDAPIIGEKKIFIKKINKPYFDHPLHYHQVCELVWIEKGYGQLIIGDYIGTFSEDEVILYNAHVPHLWKCDPAFYDNPQLSTQATTVYFPANLISSLIDSAEHLSQYDDLLRKSERGLRFSGKTKEEIIALLKKIDSKEGFSQLAYFLLISDVITRTSEFEPLASIGYKNKYDENGIERFNKTYHFLLNNFSRDISLNDVALICNMTPNAFCRFFKLRTQKTFVRFLTELRIGHACKLLQNENFSVQNICYECGYNNPVNFFKSFKVITRKTPQQYRKDMKKLVSI